MAVDIKIDVNKMHEAFRKVDHYPFNFIDLLPRGGYIEDIQDIGELKKLLDRTLELQDRTVILATIRIRAEALLGRKPELGECVVLYRTLPENSEAERLVGARIVRLLREKIAEFTDFKEAYEALAREYGDMESVHETLMRLIGEKFFPVR